MSSECMWLICVNLEFFYFVVTKKVNGAPYFLSICNIQSYSCLQKILVALVSPFWFLNLSRASLHCNSEIWAIVFYFSNWSNSQFSIAFMI